MNIIDSFNDERIEYPLKFDMINMDDIRNGDCILISIEDPKLGNALSDQICRIAGNCEWVIPDVDKTKLSLCVDILSDGLDTTLHIEA